ncbi:MAG: nucleoside hydrolase [Bacteroidales bacterium]|nr:nucleoside hydrolase [Bacteroidales bacterium]
MKNSTNFKIMAVASALALLPLSSCKNSAPKEAETKTPAREHALVFDCDPGTDDTYAMFLLKSTGNAPDYTVATFGNSTIEYTFKNLFVLNNYFDVKSSVFRGVEKPYDGHEVTCGDFHGADGLAGLSDEMVARFGITQAMVDSAKSYQDLAKEILSTDKVDYIAVGPLATLGHIIKEYPEAASHINHVYIMGGGINSFNKDGDTEYNFFGDGIADTIVWASGVEISLFPIDVTYLCAQVELSFVDSLDFGKYPEMETIIRQNSKSNIATGQSEASAIIHDALPVLYYKFRDKFKMEDYKLTVNERGHLEKSDAGRLVHVAVDMERDLLKNEIKKALEVR